MSPALAITAFVFARSLKLINIHTYITYIHSFIHTYIRTQRVRTPARTHTHSLLEGQGGISDGQLYILFIYCIYL